MINELKKPMAKPPVLYSERSDNRDTYLLQRRPESREDKITAKSDAVSQLIDPIKTTKSNLSRQIGKNAKQAINVKPSNIDSKTQFE